MNNIKKFMGIVAVGGLVVSLGTVAFAGTPFRSAGAQTTIASESEGMNMLRSSVKGRMGSLNDESGVNQRGPGGKFGKGGGYQQGLNFDTTALETAGLITSDQATAINNLIAEKATTRDAERATIVNMTPEERQAFFETKVNVIRTTLQEELVSNNILTQDELDKIQAYMRAERLEQRQTELVTVLAPFIADSTISQEKSDEILAYMATLQVKHQAEKEAIEGKTAEEIKAYFDSHTKINPLDSMVTDNVITQAQADALTSVLCSGMYKGQDRQGGNGFRGINQEVDSTDL